MSDHLSDASSRPCDDCVFPLQRIAREYGHGFPVPFPLKNNPTKWSLASKLIQVPQ
jgi:hypothetical protein